MKEIIVYFAPATYFTPLHCNHNGCKFIHGCAIGCKKKKIKSVGEALEIKAQWRNKPRRGLCEGQWPECNACISCCVWDEAMSWLKNENSREKTPATCRGLGHSFIVIFIFCIFCRKARQRIGQ